MFDAIADQAAHQLVDAGGQAEHGPGPRQRFSIGRVQHQTAAGRHHHVGALGELKGDRSLVGSKRVLALGRKDLEDRPVALLDELVGVDESKPKFGSDQLPNRCLASAHEPSEHDVALIAGACNIEVGVRGGHDASVGAERYSPAGIGRTGTIGGVTHQILVLNGPNLNLLGTREPEVYGSDTLDDILGDLRGFAAERGAELRDVQSNSEGDLIDAIQDAMSWADGIVFNPGGFTHTSVAIRDAVAGSSLPVVECHLSNVHAREDFRHTSLLSAVCLGVVGGFGRHSYFVALDGLLRNLG